MRRPKMRRRVFYLDAYSEATLAARAKSHKVKQPTMLRALITGNRPGSDPGSRAAIADAWWDARPPSRRIRIAEYHAPHLFAAAEKAEQDAQPTIFDSTQEPSQ